MRKDSGYDLGPTPIRDLILIIVVILGPSWGVAYLTDKVIYVIPMLAVCTFILAQLFSARSKRLDDDAIGKGKKSKNDHIEIAGDH